MDEKRITQIGYYRNVVNELIQIQLYKEHNHDYEHKIFELKQSFLNFSRSFDINIIEESFESYIEIDLNNIFLVIQTLSLIMCDDSINKPDLYKIMFKIDEFIEDL